MLTSDARWFSVITEYAFPKLICEAQLTADGHRYFAGDRETFCNVLRDIPPGVVFLHRELGSTHFNISSTAIMYNPMADRFVVSDFSCAVKEDQIPDTYGRPGYTTPEAIPGLRTPGEKPGPQMDSYALGVVLLYVLGKIPLPEGQCWAYSSSTEDALASEQYLLQMMGWRRRVNSAVERLSGRSAEILGSMLEINPAQRMSSLDLVVLTQDVAGEDTLFSGWQLMRTFPSLRDKLAEIQDSTKRRKNGTLRGL
ncbi:Protein kinase-like protein [Metarhizium anisopliae]|nr:Protein kinase-like protein [Metarhizium anisopliae]